MNEKNETQSKWLIVVVLSFIFIILIIAQTKPDSSINTSQAETKSISKPNIKSYSQAYLNSSNLLDQTPQIEAIGISYNGESYIYVAGELAREGDIINGFRIINIYPDKVEFDKDGKAVVGIISSKQKSTKSRSNNLSQQSVISTKYYIEDSENQSNQYERQKYSDLHTAENGSYYGQISENTGRAKTVYVNGYYRKDGTYVRSHYRSPPR